jgi:hypothetical protein
MPRQQNLRARRNTPFVQAFAVTDAAGTPVDLTGHTAGMQVRLYGMQPGDPMIDLGTVTTELTEGLTLSGSTVAAYIERLPLAFMPSGNVEGRDDSFVYDLIMTAPDGYSWVERWGDFDLAEGVTAEPETFLLTDTGAVLTTADGAYLEVA